MGEQRMTTKGTRTRQNIVDRSLQLFTVKGYFNTSISDILEATGLTKGGLYGHFKSKEDIWYAVYDQAVSVWREIVLNTISSVDDPIERIERTVENDMRDYLGAEVFEGGCFFFNMLTELSGQSSSMSRHILKGYVRFSRLLQQWLKEADTREMLKPGIDLREVANFIVITVNGAAPLYAASRDPLIWKQTISQLRYYLKELRR